MSEYSRPKKKKKKKSALLPIMGLALAALLIVISYIAAPYVLEAVGSFNDEWDAKIRINNNPNNDIQTELIYLMTFVLWLSLLGLSTVLVSVAVGKDPEQKAAGDVSASPANKQAYAKQLKRDLRDAKRRAKKQRRKKS